MTLHPFVFSNNPRFRIGRHAIFWVSWILYYTIISTFSFSAKHGFARSFFGCLTEVSLSTPLDMCFCYFIIYFLFPHFLFKGRYLQMLLLWLIASIVFMVAFEANATYIVPFIRGWFGLPVPMRRPNYIEVFFSLFSQINMEGCIAASIKLGKLWYIKQQEIDLLKQEKEKIQPHEQKGLMHPAFLAELLTRIEVLADTRPLVVAKSIKKIRNLVISMLYENARAQVLLKNELSLLQEYIYLEETIAEENLHVDTYINVAATTETIAPFIILPLVENAFRQVHLQPLKEKRINIKLELDQGILHVFLKWNKPVDTSTMAQGRNVILQNISKRLQLIYPQSYELKIFIEVEQVKVDLKVDLKKAIN
ncbi:histidine kinase [Segetibacter koreensis]|uniref:histidine kinase n=1 Tax=Segetibacter koreensis TaxID=398037 RepID=UPI0012FB71E8|nr:histidine kinase [Segetibacter koreensis]